MQAAPPHPHAGRSHSRRKFLQPAVLDSADRECRAVLDAKLPGGGLGFPQESPVCKRALHFPRMGWAANVPLVVDSAAALSVASQP
jgi:hypothetical protein